MDFIVNNFTIFYVLSTNGYHFHAIIFLYTCLMLQFMLCYAPSRRLHTSIVLYVFCTSLMNHTLMTTCTLNSVIRIDGTTIPVSTVHSLMLSYIFFIISDCFSFNLKQ